jgi:hypothetical protein
LMSIHWSPCGRMQNDEPVDDPCGIPHATYKVSAVVDPDDTQISHNGWVLQSARNRNHRTRFLSHGGQEPNSQHLAHRTIASHDGSQIVDSKRPGGDVRV